MRKSGPNLLRIETVLKPTLTIDWDQVKPLTIDPSQTPIFAEIAPALAGYANLDQVSAIDLEKAAGEFPLQRLIFRAARKLYLQNEETFSGDRQYLAVQLIRLVEAFLIGEKLNIPSLWHQEPVRRRILVVMNMDLIVGHVSRFVKLQNMETLSPCFDQEFPIESTGFMRTWFTTKFCEPKFRR